MPSSSLLLEGTILELSGLGIPPYSARGLTQTLEPIGQAAQFDRDVNGGLVDLSPPSGFRKYRSTISSDGDVQPPGFNEPPIGQVVTVSCVRELGFLTALGSAGPARDVVSGSERIVGDWTFYRPILTMVIVGFSSSVEEWPGITSWSLELEEQ